MIGLQIIFIRIEDFDLIVVNAYLPCNGDQDSFSCFLAHQNLIEGLIEEYPTTLLLICGDFNARIGRDLVKPDLGLTGAHIFHNESSENGQFLWSTMVQFGLADCATIFSSSTLVTRSEGSFQSQLDHILISRSQLHHISGFYGSWQPISDHKLISFSIRINETASKCK